MNLHKCTQWVLWANGTLVVFLVLTLLTPLLDLRDYRILPPADRDWQKVIEGLDVLAKGDSRTAISNKSAFRTMRSVVQVKERVGSIGDYSLTGQATGKAYFLHKKTGTLLVRGVGEDLEGYVITKIDEKGVEFEKGGAITELPL